MSSVAYLSLRRWAIIIIVVFFGWRQFARAPATAESATTAGYHISELAPYGETIRVLSLREYHSGREANLSPLDIAAGWGPMARPEVYSKFQVSQSGRWYHWNTAAFPIPRREVETHSANIHIVPADAGIAAKLARLRREDLIWISGSLIQVNADDGWIWKSSLSREDTGQGACELLLLKEIRWVNR